MKVLYTVNTWLAFQSAFCICHYLAAFYFILVDGHYLQNKRIPTKKGFLLFTKLSCLVPLNSSIFQERPRAILWYQFLDFQIKKRYSI